MIKKCAFFLMILILTNCSKKPESYIEHLNGYWEIDEVTMPDGSKRDYGYNETIDFFSVSDSLIGFRKKLKPNFDGTFSTFDNEESLKVIVENDSLNLYYKTPYAEWKETVIKANEHELIIQNPTKIRYLYKRYEPLVIE